MNTNGKITAWAITILIIIASCIFLIAQSNVRKTGTPADHTPNTQEPVSVTDPTPTTSNFTDEGKTFSFVYPTTGVLSSSTAGDSTEWRQNTERSGTLLAKVVIGDTAQPKTNFRDARFTVGTSSDTIAVKTCLTDAMGGTGKGSKVAVNGIEFTKLSMSDAGAGNLYDTTSYRTVHNGQCYAIEYTIHTTQLANYPVEAGITAYDKAAVTSMMDGIVQSFTFL